MLALFKSRRGGLHLVSELPMATSAPMLGFQSQGSVREPSGEVIPREESTSSGEAELVTA
jgi:hypothetical protein